MMKFFLPCLSLMLVTSLAVAQNNVTFSVDMSNYTGSTANGVFVNGNFNGWCGACNAMTDADSNGIWTVTLPITAGTIEYKFTVNGWTDQESLTPGLPCTLTTGAFTNRVLTFSADTTLSTVCWNTCSSCVVINPTDSVSVTFKVNTANITVDPAGLFLAGGGTFGNPGENPMSDADGDGIWEITVRLGKGKGTDYTFTNGNCPSWGCKENITGLPCAVAPFNDRRLLGVYADTTLMTCFATCSSDGTCPVPSTKVNVTFQVDMSNETVSGGVFMGANFDNWSGGLAMSDADGDGVWTATASINANNTYEWKFINGTNWSNPEEFDAADSSCTLQTGTFINRVVTVGSSDTTLPAFAFNSCVYNVGTRVTFKDGGLFEIHPTMVSDFSILTFSEEGLNIEKTVYVFNAVGQNIQSNRVAAGQSQHRLDVSGFAKGLYFVTVITEGGFAQTSRILVGAN